MYDKIESYQVEIVEGIGYEIRGKLKDDIHDLNSRIVIDVNSFTIIEAEVEAAYVPFEICHRGLRTIDAIIGASVERGLNRVVTQQIMGKQGCYHLGEMVMNSVKAFLQAASREGPYWMNENECQNRWSEWVNNYKNICIYFSQPCISPEDIQKSLGQDIAWKNAVIK